MGNAGVSMFKGIANALGCGDGYLSVARTQGACDFAVTFVHCVHYTNPVSCPNDKYALIVRVV